MRDSMVYLLPLGEGERRTLSALTPGQLDRLGVDRQNLDRLGQKKNRNAYQQSLAVHLLCLFGLRERYPGKRYPVLRTSQGQPVTLGGAGAPGPFLSCTHSREMAAAAVSPVPVGIDLESLRPANRRVARRMFSPGEWAALEDSPCPNREFTRLWTLHEAYGKLLGCGLAGMPPVEFLPSQAYRCSDREVSVCRWEEEGWILSTLLRGESAGCSPRLLTIRELLAGLAD